MTDVPVIWGNLNPEAIARGYWDTTILDDIFSQDLWRPAGGYQFVHYESWDAVPGDVLAPIVVIPARHNVPYVPQINALLGELSAAIVMLVGDEEHLFPWRELHHPNMAVWVMTPDPHVHADVEVRRRFGTMYPPFTRPTLATAVPPGETPGRDLAWFFAGQDTHTRRAECIAALRTVDHALYPGWAQPTEGFTQGFPPDIYTKSLAHAKIAPCPSGPVTPDTFRLWEALEAGCIPLADGCTPAGRQEGFWQFLLGEEPPFPVVEEWGILPRFIPMLLDHWPASANRIFAWYQGYRRRLVYSLHQDVEEVLGVPRPTPAAEDLVTAIIPTSPIASHPSTAILEETVASIRERLGDCEILIGFDGVRPEQEHRRADYEEYQRAVLWMCAHRWHNVLPVRLDEFGHQANVARRLLDLVATPTVLFVEHDTPLIGDIPFAELAGILRDGELANVIRLSHEASVLPPHQYLFPEIHDPPVDVHGLPLLRTVQWSQRPHLARTDWYRGIIDRYFGAESRTMIEDSIYGVLHTTWHEYGWRGWRAWRVWMYAPPGDMKRSTNLDGRGDDPKYDMVWRYDGDTPEFAPYPVRDETPTEVV